MIILKLLLNFALKLTSNLSKSIYIMNEMVSQLCNWTFRATTKLNICEVTKSPVPSWKQNFTPIRFCSEFLISWLKCRSYIKIIQTPTHTVSPKYYSKYAIWLESLPMSWKAQWLKAYLKLFLELWTYMKLYSCHSVKNAFLNNKQYSSLMTNETIINRRDCIN